jgi:hypothetical protein
MGRRDSEPARTTKEGNSMTRHTEQAPKIDGFGIRHLPRCRQPTWGIGVDREDRSKRVQVCTACGIVWRSFHGSTPPQPTQGYPNRGTRR